MNTPGRPFLFWRAPAFAKGEVMQTTLNDIAAVRDDDGALTIQEFCARERMSDTTYYKLKKRGLGPEEVRFPGMAFVRITAAARKEWHTRVDQWREKQAAALEAQRRSELCSRAGKRAAASPLHVSKKHAKQVACQGRS